MKTLWLSLVQKPSLSKALHKGDVVLLREELAGKTFFLKPADVAAMAKWFSKSGGDAAFAKVSREVSLQAALREVPFNHHPAFEDFFDKAGFKSSMESASKSLAASAGRSQTISALRTVASRPVFSVKGKPMRHEAVFASEASKLCTQAASALRYL